MQTRVGGNSATDTVSRGELYTADTVGDQLATRNLMEELRWAGLATGGPAAYSAADRQRFAASLGQL